MFRRGFESSGLVRMGRGRCGSLRSRGSQQHLTNWLTQNTDSLGETSGSRFLTEQEGRNVGGREALSSTGDGMRKQISWKQLWKLAPR